MKQKNNKNNNVNRKKSDNTYTSNSKVKERTQQNKKYLCGFTTLFKEQN